MKNPIKPFVFFIATAALVSALLPAQSPEAAVPAKAAAAPKTKHVRLCEQLGLKVGKQYVIRLEAEKFHYYQVRSLGANGWVLMKDSNSSNIWLNLSQVISITPVVSF